MHRSLSYLAILQAAMIGFMFLSMLEERGLIASAEKLLIPCIALTFLGFGFVGFLEWKIGMHGEEQHNLSKKNPMFTKWDKQLSEMHDKVCQDK